MLEIRSKRVKRSAATMLNRPVRYTSTLSFQRMNAKGA